MGLPVDKRRAAEVFAEALRLSTAPEQDFLIPDVAEWTRRLDGTKQRTFTPAYGSALLAKATEPKVDTLAVKRGSGHRGYAAPSIGEVFFDGVKVAGIDAKCKSPQFLNNQPFFSSERIGHAWMPTCRDKAALDILVAALEEADFFDAAGATRALATFLHVRRELTPVAPTAPLPAGTRALGEMAKIIDGFISADTEGGRRGQAFVMAALSLVHPHVTSRKVNDPSRKIPGDVVVWSDGENDTAVLVAEVKQRLVHAGTLLAFGEEVAEKGLGAAMYVALAPNQEAIELSSEVQERFGVALTLFTTVEDLLRSTIVWSGRDAGQTLRDLPEAMRKAFVALDVDNQTLLQWHDLMIEPGA